MMEDNQFKRREYLPDHVQMAEASYEQSSFESA